MNMNCVSSETSTLRPGVLQSLARHIRDRTLPDRIQWKIDQYRRERRETWWRARRGQADSFLYEVQPGVRLRLYLDSELCHLIYCREFEWAERAFLNVFLRSGDMFVDVGANIGLFTMIAAKLVGPSGRVLAFEPTTRTYERLCDNVLASALTNVSCLNIALSDAGGELEIRSSHDGFDAWNSFAQPTMGSIYAAETVRTARWDDIARERGLAGAVTMMKVDVEGWEEHVLAGAATELSPSEAPVLQIEFADNGQPSHCRNLYAALERLGYEVFTFDAATRLLKPEMLRDYYACSNLIATKNAAMVNRRLSESRIS